MKKKILTVRVCDTSSRQGLQEVRKSAASLWRFRYASEGQPKPPPQRTAPPGYDMAAHVAPELDFKSDSFTPVQWLNSVLSKVPSHAHLEQTASTRAQSPSSGYHQPLPYSPGNKPSAEPGSPLDENPAQHVDVAGYHDILQQLSTDAHAELDAALSRALSAVPWAVREAEKVRQRATSLRSGVDGVGERVAGVEGAVSAAVAAIAEADTLVRRVEGSADLLRQAAHADALLTRLDSLLASSSADGSDLVSAADVVAELRAALDPLRQIPDLAERFSQLDTADRKLETLAAPRLKTALATRNAPAASNAKIVFDRAGRDNAFSTKYVDIRGAQIASMWSTAWACDPHLSSGAYDDSGKHPDSAIPSEPDAAAAAAPKSQVPSQNIASTQAALRLDAFYGDLFDFARKEADWLAVAFPSLRDILLPSLIAAALSSPVAPSLDALRPDPAESQSSGMTRLHHSALRSARAAWDFARILCAQDLPGGKTSAAASLPLEEQVPPAAQCKTLGRNDAGTQSANRDLRSRRVLDAVNSLLFASRIFWSSWPALAARAAEVAIQNIPLNIPADLGDRLGRNPDSNSVSKPGPAAKQTAPVHLSNTAKAVEGCGARLEDVLDSLTTQISNWTGGVGVMALPPVSAAASTALSNRILELVRRDHGPSPALPGGKDDWNHVAGALRLLRAVGSLKQSWESRKEVCLGIAAGPASTAIELATSLKDKPRECLAQLLEWGEMGMWAEISAVFQLIEDENTYKRAVTALDGIGESEVGRTGDFSALLDGVHRVVYDSMFIGVRNRFQMFDRETLWGKELHEDSYDGAGVGLSNSPLPYATEIADYLMTIPQQLEPYVPIDDEDEGYATPASVFAFSAENDQSNSITPGNAVQVEGEYVGSSNTLDHAADSGFAPSFAGVWIGAIAVGTMELYAQRIGAIPRLSSSGAQQLSIDSEYICNVLGALGVTPTKKMDVVRQLLDCPSDAEVFSRVYNEQKADDLRRLVEKLALARGVTLSKK